MLARCEHTNVCGLRVRVFEVCPDCSVNYTQAKQHVSQMQHSVLILLTVEVDILACHRFKSTCTAASCRLPTGNIELNPSCCSFAFTRCRSVQFCLCLLNGWRTFEKRHHSRPEQNVKWWMFNYVTPLQWLCYQFRANSPFNDSEQISLRCRLAAQLGQGWCWGGQWQDGGIEMEG